jgi:kynureninase
MAQPPDPPPHATPAGPDGTLRDRARRLDAADPPPPARRLVQLPPATVYLDGNSLGPASAPALRAVERAAGEWARLGVRGWSDGPAWWFGMAERVAARLAPLVGAEPGELAVGGTTTQQLHQLLATFYRPAAGRTRILIERGSFPTDRHAVDSLIRMLGRSPARDVLEIAPDGDGLLSADRLHEAVSRDDVALAVLPGVVYTTGQRLAVADITASARRHGVLVLWDLSHSAGLVPHRLHDEADLAVFCTYKYLNGGPGAPAAAFVHRRFHPITPALQGWWGSDKRVQFAMDTHWHGAADAGALQLGTPSIVALAGLDGAIDLFDTSGLDQLWDRSLRLSRFLIDCADKQLADLGVEVRTPRQDADRGGHVALAHRDGAALSLALRDRGVVVDFRPPDLIRLAPAPLYITYADVQRAIDTVREILTTDAVAPYRDRIADSAVT